MPFGIHRVKGGCMDINTLNKQVQAESLFLQDLKREVSKVIVGQEDLLEKMLVALLADGHILIEGVPGLAKTLAVKTLSQAIHAQFQRIQFTPDLLPADITGTLIFNPKEGVFYPKRGPVFSNFVLADEINRSPAKVQSALLEAMQERQVTIGEKTYALPSPFMVLATQNPVEQEGTYPLPEAQVDRFMLKVLVTYPTKEEEKLISRRATSDRTSTTESTRQASPSFPKIRERRSARMSVTATRAGSAARSSALDGVKRQIPDMPPKQIRPSWATHKAVGMTRHSPMEPSEVRYSR